MIRVEALTQSYGGLTAVDQVSFEIGTGEIVGLLGHNGAGKTTSVQSLLGTEAEPEYRQDEPSLEVRITREGGEDLGYRFSKPEDAAYYALKRSDLNYYFKVAEYIVDPIREITREKLVQDATDEVSSEPAGDKRDDKDDDASAVEEQEFDVDGESAKEHR